MAILEMKNIHKAFVGVPVLMGVSLTIHEGDRDDKSKGKDGNADPVNVPTGIANSRVET
jgi:hypothetical protein